MALKPEHSANEKLAAQLHEADTLIDRLTSLYNQWFAGIEKRAPIEVRARLEAMMQQISGAVKLTPSTKFKYQGLQSKFQTYRDRWDKLIKKKGG